MKAIIVDDEPKGQEILQKMVGDHCPEIRVVATASGADEAYRLIREHKPELVFLDIEMPGDSGFSLLERFEKVDFHIIVTTAFDEYALRAIKHHVFDYLLKPIDIDELMAATAALKRSAGPGISGETHKIDASMLPSRLTFGGKLGLPVKEGIFYCAVADVIRVESDGSYCTFYIAGGKRYMVSKGLKEYEDLLPEREFFRVHKSHLINIHKVTKYIRTDGNFLEMEDGSVIEVARRKKDEFLQVMNALG